MNKEALDRLQTKHGEIVAAAKLKMRAAEAKSDGPSAADREEVTALLAQADAVKAEASDIETWIQEQVQVVAHEAWRNEVQKVQLPAPMTASEPDPGVNLADKPKASATATPEYAAAWNGYMKYGARYPVMAAGYANPYANVVNGAELAAAAGDPMQTDIDSAGGFLIPDRLASELVQEKDREFLALQRVRSQTLGFGESIEYPYTKKRLGRAQRAGERGGSPPQGRPDVRTITLNPALIWYRTEATIQMLGNRHFNVEQYLSDELFYTLMYRCEEDIWVGKGGMSSLGLLTAAAAGISTDRDQTTGKTGGVAFSGVHDAFYKKLRPPYWKNSSWYLNPASVGEFRKLTDDDGQYLWRPSLEMDAPDMLEKRPVEYSEFIPAEMTDGTYIGCLTDMRYYRRAEYPSIAVQRLVEMGAEDNEIRFIARKWDDGNPILEEATVRLKVGA